MFKILFTKAVSGQGVHIQEHWMKLESVLVKIPLLDAHLPLQLPQHSGLCLLETILSVELALKLAQQLDFSQGVLEEVE
jgi:hypothetical protein